MGNFRLFAKLALGVGIAVAGISCDKENKNEFVPHADAEFSMKISELRQSHEFIWHYTQDGRLSCLEQNLQELWVTFWNECILESYSDDEKFDGVNFSSSHPELVRIEKIDERSCRLVYVADSPEGMEIEICAFTDNIRKSFTVHSKSSIGISGILVSINGKELILPFKGEDSGNQDTVLEPVVKDVRTYKGDLFEIVDLVPENASFRYVKRFTSSPVTMTAKEDIYGPWPKDEMGVYDVDWSEIQGRKAWFPGQAPNFFLKLKIETDSRKPDKTKPSPRLWQTYLRGRHTDPANDQEW